MRDGQPGEQGRSQQQQQGTRTLAQQLGDEAEERAARYFEEKGFAILERNFVSRMGEVDLIVAKGLLLCFVEVRYRKSMAFGRPEETVCTEKRRKVIMAAYDYGRKQGLLEKRYIRFDVVAVTGRGERASVVHIEDAFDAELPRLARTPFL
ncbi:MAG TPA: YraN family protein [Myxococcales bacterium]